MFRTNTCPARQRGVMAAWSRLLLIVAFAAGVLAESMTADAAGAQKTISVWDGVYTAAQAERGKAAFDTYCASCHSSDLSGAQGPALAGNPFMQRWDFRNVSQLFNEIKTRMPRNDPSSLSDETYADLISFILKSNAFPAGASELTPQPDALDAVRIEKSKGEAPTAEELPTGTLVLVVGCLTQTANGGWTLSNASAAVRVQSPDASKGDERSKVASTPLAGQTFQLMSVYTPLDEHKSHKMEGRGFLVKDAGGDRINIVALEMLDSNCSK
jgi:mono/diheme cytochrome c family protein